MKKELLFIAGLLSATAIAPAFAQSGNQSEKDKLQPDAASPETPSFNKLDTDDDGYINLQEMTMAGPAIAEHFNQLDSNSDRRLTEKEYARIVALPGNGVPTGGSKVE